MSYIIFEGLDGSGKDSQLEMLRNRLAKTKSVKVLAEPSNSEIGQLLRKFLSSGEHLEAFLWLFIADCFSFTTELKIEQEKNPETDYLVSRSFISSLVYQRPNHTLIEMIHHHNRIPLLPDVIIYVQTDPKVSMERINSRGEKKECFERLDILTQNHELYNSLLDGEDLPYLLGLYPEGKLPQIIVVDGTQTKEEIHSQIWAQLNG